MPKASRKRASRTAQHTDEPSSSVRSARRQRKSTRPSSPPLPEPESECKFLADAPTEAAAAATPSLAGVLPHDVLDHIFKAVSAQGSPNDLYPVLTVNQRWFECAVRWLWKVPHLQNLGSWCRLIRTLSLEHHPYDTRSHSGTEPPFRPYGRYLRHLSATAVFADSVNNSDLMTISLSCPMLLSLSLESCYQVTHRGILCIINRCPQLSMLELARGGLSHQALSRLFRGRLDSLRSLSLMLDASVRGPQLVKAMQNLPSLQKVYFQNCSMVSDEIMERMIAACPQLDDVSFLDLRSATDEAVFAIARHLGPSLKQCTLGLCSSITDVAIIELARSSPQLRALTLALLGSITDASLEGIAQHLPELTELGVFSIQNITNTGVDYISRRCTELRYLCLLECTNVTSSAMTLVAWSLQKLEYLNITGCSIFEATPELYQLKRRCIDFIAGNQVHRNLHLYELMLYTKSEFGTNHPVRFTFEVV
ncbi:uncharacterized protein BJ171DRAFT_509394 [Polychytrium aggregatum]|uniref:uncharacterized protein n=1 Tax=Polychytrium aggregatum TaxID=110093 RepID=UPI0022FF1A75|nr:uncharacterized protein BJ171DRAFT_509394 [Polychytrium aggregatum]KAI9203714.1 hypothetical protein BJ171DRAFT_509394 [Polychytrium aggregatum]